VGGLVGVLFAEVGIRFAKAFGPHNLPRLREVGLDLPALAFAFAITLVTGILFGLAPAITASRQNLVNSLKEGAHGLAGRAPGHRIRKALLVSEVALALVLVIAAGLLTQSFFRMLTSDPGFNPARVLTFELSLPATKYSDQQRIVTFYRNALEHIRSVSGVQAAGIVETVPLGGATEATAIRIPGRIPSDPNDNASANYTMISPGYLTTIGTAILRGRDFVESDTADSMPVALISLSMARKFWPSEDPVGKQVGPRSTKYPAATIVGITADVKHLSLREEPIPEMYVPFTQKVWPSLYTMTVALRTSSEPTSVTATVRQALHSVDPDLPLAKITTMTHLVDESMAKPKFAMLLLGSFGVLSLLLASVGMYGVVSYSVAERTQEISIRMAIGAQRTSVFAMVLSQGALLLALGISLGLLASFAASRLMSSFLYGVQPTDVATYIGVSIFLAGVTLLACYIPARRAMRIDPMVALRYE